MSSHTTAPKALAVYQASDLPLLLSTLQAEVDRVRLLTPLIPESLHQELSLVLSETLSDANSLFNIVAVQQQLTGVDPLASPDKADSSLASEDEDDGFDDNIYAQPDEPLSDEAKQLLMTVFAAYDSLNSKQVAGLAHAAGCSNQQVRTFFSDMRTKLRNITTAAVKRAGKAVDQQQQQQPQAPEHAVAGPGAGKYGQPRQQHGQPSPLNPNRQQQQQYTVFGVPLASEGGNIQVGQHAQGLLTQGSLGSPNSQQPAAAAAATAAVVAAAAAGLGPTCAAISANINSQKEKLSKMLDQQNGAITSGGRFLGALSSITTWSGRTAALAALTASYTPANNSSRGTPGSSISRQLSAGSGGASAAVRGQLGSSRLLDVLEGWLKEATADKQITFMIRVLQALAHISLSTALLQGTSISHTVQELTTHDNTHVAAAATELLNTWATTTGYAAAAGGSKQQQRQSSVLDGLIALGGNRQLSSGYKRRVNMAVKRKIEEMELVGDVQRGPSGAIVNAPAAAAGGAGGSNAPMAAAGALPAATAAGVSSSQLKRPSKRPHSADASAAAAANGGAAASTTPGSEAARRLAALHALNRGSQQQQQQHRPASAGPKTIPQLLAALSPQQRLWCLAPAGRAAASFLAAAGPWAAEVTHATQEYDKAVHRWLTHRVGAALREQQTAAAAAAAQVTQQQQQQGASTSSSDDGWECPPAVPLEALSERAAGQDSKIANDPASLKWQQQQQQQNQQQNQQQQQQQQSNLQDLPDEAPALASAAAAAVGAPGGVRHIPWQPTSAAEDLTQRCWMWAAGVRLPMHIVKPPTTAEFNRFKHTHEEEQQRLLQGRQQQQPQQQQLAPGQYYAAAAQVQGYQQQQQYLQPQSHQLQSQVSYVQQQAYQQQQQLQPPAAGYPPQQQQQQQQQPPGPVYMMGQQRAPQQQQPVIIVVPGAPPAPSAPQQQAVPQVLMQQVGAPQQQQGYFPQGY